MKIKFFSNNGPTNFAIVTTLLLLLAVVALLFLKSFFYSDSYNGNTIQPPTNALKVNMTMQQMQKAAAMANAKSVLATFTLQATKLKGYNQSQAIDLYKSQIQQQGWRFVDNTDNGWYFFRNGDDAIALTASPQEDATGLDYMQQIAPELRNQLEAGDVLVVLLYGSYSKIRLLGD